MFEVAKGHFASGKSAKSPIRSSSEERRATGVGQDLSVLAIRDQVRISPAELLPPFGPKATRIVIESAIAPGVSRGAISVIIGVTLLENDV
jgi:hypothetical protein